MLVWVYSCQNATLLEITCRGSYIMLTYRALLLSLMPATKALRSLCICGGSPKHSLLINAICSEILRVKSGIFGQTAKFGQRPSLFNISNIGIKNKLTKQTVKILMRRLIRSRLIWIYTVCKCSSEFTCCPNIPNLTLLSCLCNHCHGLLYNL